jgi:DNA-binding response OmpR family regulator
MVSLADILNARILVVDDQEANVRLLEGMLRIAGYTSIESTMDPFKVCELHRKNRYSLILLDLQMPGMDGFQVMEGLKEIEEDGYLPVLVITAQPAHKSRALEAGAKDFVSKPFDLAELRARVHNILEVRLLHLETKNYSKALEETVRELEASREVVRLFDIAEHKAAEERLHVLSDAVEQSPVSIVITDLQGNIEYVNPKATETSGYTFEELGVDEFLYMIRATGEFWLSVVRLPQSDELMDSEIPRAKRGVDLAGRPPGSGRCLDPRAECPTRYP